MVYENVACDKVVRVCVCVKEGLCVCVSKMVCNKDVRKMVCEKDVCQKWCVTKLCVEDGMC